MSIYELILAVILNGVVVCIAFNERKIKTAIFFAGATCACAVSLIVKLCQ